MPNPDVSVSYDLTSNPGQVIVTVSSNDPYGSVGELRFIPGDNYDNDDVDITVLNVVVSDPILGSNTLVAGGPDWGNGIIEGAEQVQVKVDAVAEAPEVDITGVDHAANNPVLAGGQVTIKGQVSFEDLRDGSEDHFILLEVRDGYYPDSFRLSLGGASVTLPVTHFQASPPVAANYVLQELVTADDGQPHLFYKLPVDEALRNLTAQAGLNPERLDDIDIDITYQTREWAPEGAGLHFAAIATEEVEEVREFDVNYDITNDELPFDQQLEAWIPGYKVEHPNNTAITVAMESAHVYWDSSEETDVEVRGYVFENDRPDDHVRDNTLEIYDENYYRISRFPVAPELTAHDLYTRRNYGTGHELKIPDHPVEVTLTLTPGYDQGHGSFYFLPQTTWDAFVNGHPIEDSALNGYKVDWNVTKHASSGAEHILVFIPENDAYGNNAHSEMDGAHKDLDVHFDYTIVTNQYGPNGQLYGTKRYTGTDEVVRIDTVANQADILQAGDTTSTDVFSLWGGVGRTSSFPLTVRFHDLDSDVSNPVGANGSVDYENAQSEQHYILLEVVPNFTVTIEGVTYRSGEKDHIYTHVESNGGDTDSALITRRMMPVPGC